MKTTLVALRDQWAQAPWWIQIGAVWAISRIWVWGWTVAIFPFQQTCPFSNPVQPGILGFITNWDSAWYQKIYDGGYPVVLPINAAGAVDQNPWAFLPGYPAVVKVFSVVPGVTWQIAAPLVALVASLGFALVAYRLFRLKADHATSLVAVALVVFAPAAAVLQYGYAESLTFFLVAVVLYLLATERYAWAIPVVLIADLTRPIAAPLALTCLIAAGVVVYRQIRKHRGLPAARLVALAALCLASVIGIGLWPMIAAVVTGVPDAYFQTEGAWQLAGSQLQHNVFLVSMMVAYGPIGGLAMAALLFVLLGAFMVLEPVRRLGIVMWAWVGAWLGYQLLMNGMGRADLRLGMTAFPLALVAAAMIKPRWAQWSVIAIFAVMQIGWIWFSWRCGGPGAVHADP
jgi:hypothetical protein